MDNFHVKCQIWRHASSQCFKAVRASPKLDYIAHKSILNYVTAENNGLASRLGLLAKYFILVNYFIM